MCERSEQRRKAPHVLTNLPVLAQASCGDTSHFCWDSLSELRHHCDVVQGGASNEGGPTGFGCGNLNGGVSESIVIRDKACAGNFGVATPSLGWIVVAAHEGGPNGFGGGNMMVGVPDWFEIDDDPLPENFGAGTTASVASW